MGGNQLVSSREMDAPDPKLLVVHRYCPPQFIVKTEITVEPVKPVLKKEPEESVAKNTETKRKKKRQTGHQFLANNVKSKPKVHQLPEIFATNALLRKRIKIKDTQVNCPAEPKELTTDEDEVDFFVDAYKQNNALFSCFSHQGCGLGELEKRLDEAHELGLL